MWSEGIEARKLLMLMLKILDLKRLTPLFILFHLGSLFLMISSIWLKEICKILTKKVEVRKNVTPLQFQVVTELKNNTNLIICQADKGGIIVLLDKELYASAVFEIFKW